MLNLDVVILVHKPTRFAAIFARRKKSIQPELLSRYEIEFDERYMWD